MTITCQAKNLRWRKGEPCKMKAKYVIAYTASGGEIVVCGNHARGWTPVARIPIGGKKH